MSNFVVMAPLDQMLKDVKETLRNYFLVNNIKSFDQVSTIIKVMIDSLKTVVTSNESTETTVEQLEEVLKRHYDKKKVTVKERYKFFNRHQEIDESITSYVTELKELATTCLFGESLEDTMRDKLVCGIKDKNIQEHLLAQEDLTFDCAYQYALTKENLVIECELSEPDENLSINHQNHFQAIKNEAEPDASTEESLNLVTNIKEEPEPFKSEEYFETQQEILELECEPEDNLQDEPVTKKGKLPVSEPFICDKCGNQFKTYYLLGKHMLFAHGRNGFTCTICDLQFATYFGLQRHSKIHDPLSRFWCRICNDGYSDKKSLRKHMNCHIPAGLTYKCNLCDKHFNTNASFLNHLDDHPKILTGRNFVCEVCNKSFARKDNIKQHMRAHINMY